MKFSTTRQLARSVEASSRYVRLVELMNVTSFRPSKPVSKPVIINFELGSLSIGSTYE
jgi:hypothetical protein